MRRARRRCFPRLVRAIKFEVSSTVMMSKEIGTSAHEARTAGKTVSSRFRRLMRRVIPGEQSSYRRFTRVALVSGIRRDLYSVRVPVPLSAG